MGGTIGYVSESVVTASQFAALLTGGTGNAVNVTGDEGAFAWTYGSFSGSVTSSGGSAVVASIGSAFNATIHGKESALAITVGSFSGDVTADDEYAGIISLLNASGTLHAGKGAVILSDGSVNVAATVVEDLLIWARGDVHGSYSAGRDAAVVSHGTYDASLTADNDIVFAYARASLHGSLTAGRWIGDGSTSVPMDPTIIDDVFSHGDIMAQIVAGTSASTDSTKGRIGTIGAIGNAGGSYSASHIGRIRTAGIVTAGLNVGGVAFSGGSGSGNGVVIQENQTTLITNVPLPVLDPSDRDAILAEAAAERTAAEADRLEFIAELNLSRVALQAIRQAILDEVAALRASILEEADATQTQVDQAVDAAQWLAETGIAVARQLIETVYRLREAGYLKEQRGFEQFRDTARNVLNLSLQQLATLRAVAFTELTKADEQFQRQQQLIFAAEAAHINDHYARWDAAYAKMKQDIADSQPTTEQILNGIQLTLDGLGFAPGVGAIPDVLNAIISAGRGNFGEALFSLGAAVPLFGDIAKGGKMLAKGRSKLNDFAAITSAVAKNADLADEIIEGGTRAGAEVLQIIQKTCFATGTPLLTPDGAKRIEEFQIGDQILTKPENLPDALVVISTIEEVFHLQATIVEIGVGGRILETTGEHPFFVVEKGWVRANALEPGDLLLGHMGCQTSVESVTLTDKHVPVFNVRVAQHHTYFVGDIDWNFSVWVHNAYSIKQAVDGTFEVFDASGNVVAKGLSELDAKQLQKAYNFGINGVQTASKTVFNKKGLRIDFENPNPGVRAGNLHIQIGESKYYYDPIKEIFATLTGSELPRSAMKILESNAAQAALQKALRMLGEL